MKTIKMLALALTLTAAFGAPTFASDVSEASVTKPSAEAPAAYRVLVWNGCRWVCDSVHLCYPNAAARCHWLRCAGYAARIG